MRSTTRTTTTLTILSMLGLAASAGCEPAPSPESACADLLAVMEACYPELPTSATCTAATLERYQAADLESMSCEAIDDAGKADVFSVAGCPEGEHECGWLFCCTDDYAIHFAPTESDWDIVPVVQAFQAGMPQDALDEIWSLGPEDLEDAYAVTFDQMVDDGLGAGERELAVEHTSGLVDLPLEEFLAAMPAAQWGTSLDHYLGGEVQVFERDAQGRIVRQLERMVLSPLPCDAETPLSNMDMTKVEQIVYEQDLVTVYWRVMYSDNGSTETDVGSVSFARYGDQTLVTFHSAHRLRTTLGLVVPNLLVRMSLSGFFSDHIRAYRAIALGSW